MTASGRPSEIVHWTEVEKPDGETFIGTSELRGLGAPLAVHFGLERLGIHHVRLPPGRRTSFPHAESLEEEFVHVLEGAPDVWLDGVLHRLKPGDSVGFPAGTGLAHSFLNNTDSEVRLLVVGEATRTRTGSSIPSTSSARRSATTGGTTHQSASSAIMTDCRIGFARSGTGSEKKLDRPSTGRVQPCGPRPSPWFYWRSRQDSNL